MEKVAITIVVTAGNTMIKTKGLITDAPLNDALIERVLKTRLFGTHFAKLSPQEIDDITCIFAGDGFEGVYNADTLKAWPFDVESETR